MNAVDVEPMTEPPAVPGVGDVLVVEGVRKTFEAENAPVRALRGANLRVPAGDFVALMGPSGCGKSTLLNLVAGLDVADEGTISVGGELVTGRTEDELSLIRREHIGIVFQFFNLLESMTALENVALPAIIAGTRRRPAESRARDLLDLLGVGDKAKAVPGPSPADSASDWPSPVHWPTSPPCCWPMSQPAPSTPTVVTRSSSSCPDCTTVARPSCWSRTTTTWPRPREHLIYMRDGQMVEAPDRKPDRRRARGSVTATPASHPSAAVRPAASAVHGSDAEDRGDDASSVDWPACGAHARRRGPGTTGPAVPRRPAGGAGAGSPGVRLRQVGDGRGDHGRHHPRRAHPGLGGGRPLPADPSRAGTPGSPGVAGRTAGRDHPCCGRSWGDHLGKRRPRGSIRGHAPPDPADGDRRPLPAVGARRTADLADPACPRWWWPTPAGWPSECGPGSGRVA